MEEELRQQHINEEQARILAEAAEQQQEVRCLCLSANLPLYMPAPQSTHTCGLISVRMF